MPFLFTPAANALFIAPNQYAWANQVPRRDRRTPPTVRFAPSSGCLYIVAPNHDQDRAIGINVPMFDANDNFVTAADAATVAALLSGTSDQRFILGAVGSWRENARAAYEALEQALDHPPTLDWGPGTYAAGFGPVGLEPLFSNGYDMA